MGTVLSSTTPSRATATAAAPATTTTPTTAKTQFASHPGGLAGIPGDHPELDGGNYDSHEINIPGPIGVARVLDPLRLIFQPRAPGGHWTPSS